MVPLAGGRLSAVADLPALAPGVIQLVWLTVPLDRPNRVDDLALLAPDEQARAARFKVERPRLVYVAGRALLRRLLGRHAGVPAEAIRFAYSDLGKPLAPGLELSFNLSNSGATVVAVVAASVVALGVDVEEPRPLAAAARRAARFFAARVAAAGGAAAATDVVPTFFRVWTGKEAYLKAVGSGITVALDSFAVDPDPARPPRLLHIGGDLPAAAAWTLLDPTLPGGRSCTVAIAGSPWHLEVVPDCASLDAAYQAARTEAWRHGISEDWATAEVETWPE